MLEISLYGNTLRQLAISFGIAALIFVLAMFAKSFAYAKLSKFASRTATGLDDSFAAAVKSTKWAIVLLLSMSLGSAFLELPPRASKIIWQISTLLTFAQIGLWLNHFAVYALILASKKGDKSEGERLESVAALKMLVIVILWVILTLLCLDNLGFNITTLVAGLGIGGIAIALAVQNVLGDFLASLSIVLDKPFVIGDFIILGNEMGTVESIGVKTTRLRSLSGEQLILSNKDLLESRLRNFKRMYERRVVFGFGITYETPLEKVEAVSAWVRDIVTSGEQIRFDRAHFKAFGASSLDFEVVYFVCAPDFGLYMDKQQEINLKLMKKFSENDVEFAYPTTLVHMAKPTPVSD